MSSNIDSESEDRLFAILTDIKHTGEKISSTLDNQNKQLTDIKDGIEETDFTLMRSNKKLVEIRNNDKMIPIVIGVTSVTGSIIGSFFSPIGSITGAIIGLSLSSTGYILKK